MTHIIYVIGLNPARPLICSFVKRNRKFYKIPKSCFDFLVSSINSTYRTKFDCSYIPPRCLEVDESLAGPWDQTANNLGSPARSFSLDMKGTIINKLLSYPPRPRTHRAPDPPNPRPDGIRPSALACG